MTGTGIDAAARQRIWWGVMIRSVLEPESRFNAATHRGTQGLAVRIGAVSYLNSKPLIEGLAEALPPRQFQLDYPSRLADDLAEDRLDIALIPSVEYFLHPEYRIISDACVATHGPVLSVKLYSRCPLGEIRTLALDEGSRTSATLARLMLLERYGVQPQLEALPLTQATDQTQADAVVLIGDRAIHPPREQFHETWDLGEEWVRWTGFPFVFAMWVARTAHLAPEVAQLLSAARDRGVAAIEQIAAREAPQLAIPQATALSYLRDNLHFRLGSAERKGLELFRELLTQAGLQPQRFS